MWQIRIQNSYKNIPNSTSYTRMKGIQYEEVENVIQDFLYQILDKSQEGK